MSEKEFSDVKTAAEIYKDLPPYLRGKIDGYAEAVKEKRATDEGNLDGSEPRSDEK